jgi:hypothetical protein
MLRSMHALPRVCSKATSPSSHVVITPSLLFNSSSRARSCSCSSSSLLMSSLCPGEVRAYTHQQAMISITSRGKPSQPPALAGALPVHRQGPIGANRHSHLVRRWQLVAMAGALTPRALVVVVIPGHLEHGDGARFEMRGKEGHCCSDSPKIEMVG